ncbi:MAG: DNA repair protein RecO [Oscillospiraceae bacterium]
MRQNTKGLILKEQNIGEFDKLITVLTSDMGIVKAFVRGAKSLKSKKQSSTALLNYSRLSFYKSKDSYIVDEAESIEVFFSLRDDIIKLSLAQYFAELALELAPESEYSNEFLRVILNSLYMLGTEKRPSLQIKSITELRLLSMAGYTPNLIACERCGEFETPLMYFDMERGLLYCENCADEYAPFELSIGIVSAMRHIVFADMNILYNFKLPENELKELSYITEKYLILKSGRKFKTLDFYNSIVEE